ncbi:MAG TPA: uroporphyrinogen-III synthase, partial [Thermoanaerobaculia bacterium]|nr:uroporphyrinogen-III synthase [Thermoanaerobaculia bacterium]
MSARALVVRSGENPFPFAPEPLEIEIVEKTSHSIVPILEGAEVLEQPAALAIFTSQVAVRRLCEEPGLLDRFRRAISKGRIAAVGSATATALEREGLPVALVASGSSESVLAELPQHLESQRVLLPRGEDASEELPAGLAQRGAHVLPIVLYRKVLRPRDRDLDREIVEKPFAAFCATSPAAARWLFEGISRDPLELLRSTPAVTLGRFTARFLASHGIGRVEISSEANFTSAARLLLAL